MRSGRLRHIITIQAPPDPTVTDDYGDPSGDWVDFAKDIRAGVEPLAGREVSKFQRDQTETPIRVVLRYISGVTAGMRVVYVDRYFEIVAAPQDPDMRGRDLILMCEERSYD